MTNGKLRQAKAVKNDEFYTEYSTISNEMEHHREQFRGKIVYCNCDDPNRSNFWKYFHENFGSLGLKKLISTYYRKDAESSYAKIYEGGDDFDVQAGKAVEIRGNKPDVNGKEAFYSAGDFRSDACLEFMKEADIISTNPPFSLFREYTALLISSKKRFIILGNVNAITYKEFFPLLQNGYVWVGYHFNKTMEFIMPDDYELKGKAFVDKNGKKHGFVPGMTWYTNLDVKKRHDGLWHKNGKFDNSQAHCYYEGNEEAYPKYANFEGIHVSSANDIPIDYDGLMAVPITTLGSFNPDELELVGSSGDRKYAKRIEDCIPVGSVYTKGGPSFYLKVDDTHYKRVFYRLVIRNRHPIKKAEEKAVAANTP